MRSKIFVAFFAPMPRWVAPSTNFWRCACITAAFFFPIALRSRSASPSVKPASTLAMRMTCS